MGGTSERWRDESRADTGCAVWYGERQGVHWRVKGLGSGKVRVATVDLHAVS